ncbi:MAG: gliding motility-associated C-terminal domain-containing protein, partial [Bacteroidota bacterium]
ANRIKRNIYTAIHTFPGPFEYTITVEDPNRNQGILNIPRSVTVPFFIATNLRIDQIAGSSTSPILTNPPIDQGCVNVPFEHNPGAYDPDGDSLSYALSVCFTTGGQVVAGYVLPNEFDPGPNNNLSVDPVTGTVLWDAPTAVNNPNGGPDLYNLCFRIDEWRNGIRIGSVLRDMQIAIENCNNQPPVIQPLDEICVLAGDLIEVPVNAIDLNGDRVELSASGEPFEVASSPALFPNTPLSNPVSQVFRWQTNCDHVRNQPYQAVFKATDDNSVVQLADFEALRIRIISLPPKNPGAQPTGNAITLTWDPVSCTNATGYKVYRRIDSIGFVPDSCQPGVPESTGYVKIATVEGAETGSFVDNNGGLGLVHGQRYCYLLVACFPGGGESIASEEFCAELIRDRPVMTRVSVEATDVRAGRMHVEWARPTEIDTLSAFPGPYRYNIYRTTDRSAGFTFVAQTSASATLFQSETMYLDTNLNTR